MAAKRTAELIPLCHPLPLTHVEVRASLEETGVYLEAEAATTPRPASRWKPSPPSRSPPSPSTTGKAVEKGMTITDMRLDGRRAASQENGKGKGLKGRIKLSVFYFPLKPLFFYPLPLFFPNGPAYNVVSTGVEPSGRFRVRETRDEIQIAPTPARRSRR